MDKLPVGQLPDLQQSNNDDEIMVITNSEYNQLKKEKISDLITDFTSTNENNALTKGTDGKMFVTDFGNASNITEGTLPVSVLPDIPKDLLPAIETSDLPLSGVTADTYAYPSSVTVNAQGQVTAIEEGSPSGANANTDLSNITEAGKEVIKENSFNGGGLEVGDIGISLFVDETKGLRRYLNGSILSINANTQGFVNKLKSIAALYPSLTCSETEWQEIAAASAVGQCGKFVINEDAGTVRLAKIVMPIQGLIDLTKLGQLVEAGLPNITGTWGATACLGFGSASGIGALSGWNDGISKTTATSGSGGDIHISLDASRSSSIYSNSDTVQQEQIQYPYFIQIATGQETEVNITNDIELNNPYTLFDSKYSEAPLYNASWLVSNGTYYSKSVYVTAYEALQVENNTAIDAGESTQLPSGTTYVKRGLSVKLSTADDITDYDFVLNTTDETFKLPLKNGSEGMFGGAAVVGNGLALGLYDGTAYNGLLYNTSSSLSGRANVYGSSVGQTGSGSSTLGNNAAIGVTTDPAKSGLVTTQGGVVPQGWYLYFYVGETVQNANLINAGRIEEIKANRTDVDGQWVFKSVNLCNNYSAGTTVIDLSDELPNDGYNYEILISCGAQGENQVLTSQVFLTSSIIENITAIGLTSSSIYQFNTFNIPVGTDRTLSITKTGELVGLWVDMYAYRRLGKNN